MSTSPQPVPARPQEKELVTNAILTVVGLNAQAFSGDSNPSTLWRRMVSNSPGIHPYYRELEAKDLDINTAGETRRLLVRSRESGVQAADEASGLAGQLATEASQFIDSIPNFRFALWELLDAPFYGYAELEILWNIADGRVGVEKLVGRPQELFSFNELTQPQTGPLRLSQFPGATGTEVPPEKFIVSSYRPRHGDRRGLPLLRDLFWPSWFMRQVLRLHLKFLEKGSGTVIVKYPSGAQDADKAKALEAAEGIAEELAVAVPETFSLVVEALQTTRTRNAEDFRSINDSFSAGVTRKILGQTLTTRGSEQQRGTQALGEVHERLMWEIIRDDAADLEEAVNEQLLKPWLLWQFGPQALDRAVRPWWTIEKEPPKDALAAADLLLKARTLRLEIPEEEARQRLQLRAPEEGEAVLEQPVQEFVPGLPMPGEEA